MAADGEGQDPGQRVHYGLKSVRGNLECVSALRIKIWVKHGDRTSYIIWGPGTNENSRFLIQKGGKKLP